MAASHAQVAAVCRHMQPSRHHDSARPAASEPATIAALSLCITATRTTVHAPEVSFMTSTTSLCRWSQVTYLRSFVMHSRFAAVTERCVAAICMSRARRFLGCSRTQLLLGPAADSLGHCISISHGLHSQGESLSCCKGLLPCSS